MPSSVISRKYYLLLDRIKFKTERMIFSRLLGRGNFNLSPPQDPTVHFVIPLFSRSRAPNWEVVCLKLQATLLALYSQSSENWRATVICQDRPEGVNFGDNIELLRFPVEFEVSRSDKELKIRSFLRYLVKSEVLASYIFYLDADDIPHPDLVKFIVDHNNGHGYYLPLGYARDEKSGAISLFGDGPNQTYPFYKLCGSSNAVRFDLNRKNFFAYANMLRGPHSKIKDRVSKYGLHLDPVPFPAMIYSFNHGSNDQLIAGHVPRKVNLIKETCIDSHERERILREFRIH